jgi:hypothetical protein
MTLIHRGLTLEQEEMRKRWAEYNKNFPKAAACQQKKDKVVLEAMRMAQHNGLDALQAAKAARIRVKQER